MRERLSRSSSLVLYWQDGQFVAEDYMSRRRAALDAGAVALLDRPETADGEPAARELLRLGFLKRGRAADPLKRWAWGPAARHFLFSTKDAHQPTPAAERQAYARRLLKTGRQPSLYKSYRGASRVKLARLDAGSPAARVLARVRSVRAYSGEAISAAQLGEILQLVWGRQGEVEAPPWGKLLEKTSLSAGNRHPVEVYPVVARVAGLRPGLYHYAVKDHRLELLRAGRHEALVRRVANGQDWVRGAAVYFLMTGVLARTMFKYRHAFALRTVFGDVGHLSQSLHVAATAMGLGAATTYTLDHSRAERFLKIDGVGEVFLAASALGRPAA